MVLIRYTLYFLGVALVTWVLTRIEIASPGGLQLELFSGPTDALGTSEYSPVELLQLGVLIICGLLFAWIAQNCVVQRPVAITFGGIALMFFSANSITSSTATSPIISGRSRPPSSQH
ncbi:MAG: hypothetical protein U5K38_15125 [Woeseiaceae bacterium]|nr:hypothetical protein [Woeseiaceae bacterium]